MARLLATIGLSATLLLPISSDALASRTPHSERSVTSHRLTSARRAALGKHPGRDSASLTVAVAERYWGAVPCGGQIAILLYRPLPSGLDPTTDGWVTFNSSLGPNNLAAPATSYTRCTISLARWQWPTRASIAEDWNMFCLTVVHEMGHLLGHPHSSISGSVMAPVFTDEANVPQICRATRLIS